MEKKTNITLRDVAAAAKVGLATASRALRNDPKTSKTTIARVKAVAEKLGYRPDPGLSRLIERRWYGNRAGSAANLGFIYDSNNSLATDAQEDYVKYKSMAERLGYTLISEDIADFGTMAGLDRRLSSQGITGLILSLLPSVPFDIKPLLGKYAAVSLGLSAYEPECPAILHDEFLCMRTAWKVLHEKGYRRIGLILPDYPESSSSNLRIGAAMVCRHYAAEKDRIPILFLKDGPQMDFSKFTHWMTKNSPEVLLANTHDRVAEFVGHGLRIPEDIPFATNNLWDPAECGRIAGYFRDNQDLFAQGVQLLNLMIRSGMVGASRARLVELVKGEWVDGDSLPLAKA